MAWTAGPDWSHGSGQSWSAHWTPEKVLAAPDPCIGLASYIEYILGVGFPTKKDLLILRKRVNEILGRYPNADYRTMCRVVQYNKHKRRKFARVYTVIDSFREAMAAGWLPELTAGRKDAKERIAEILVTETDQNWRARFLLCSSDAARERVLAEYEQRDAAA